MSRLLLSIDTKQPFEINNLTDTELLTKIRDYFVSAAGGMDASITREVRVRTFSSAPKKPVFILAYGGKTDPISPLTFIEFGLSSVILDSVSGVIDAMKLLQWVEASCNDYSFSPDPTVSVRNIGFGTSKVAQVKFASNTITPGTYFSILGQRFTFVSALSGAPDEVLIGADLDATLTSFQNAINANESLYENLTAYTDTGNSVGGNTGLYMVFTGWPPSYFQDVGGPIYTAAGGATVPPSRIDYSGSGLPVTVSDWSDDGTYNTNIINSTGRIMAIVFEDDVSPIVRQFRFHAGDVGAGEYFQTPIVSGNSAEEGHIYNGNEATLFEYTPNTSQWDQNEVIIRRNKP